jgi:WD40 repeat protein
MAVTGCAWSPDSSRIVSASNDHTLRIWDAKTGAALATLIGHSMAVTGCAWSPDSSRIVSASYDGTVRIWHAATGRELPFRSYHLTPPRGEPTWATLDHHVNRIVACGENAWRSLGWIVPDPDTGIPMMLPAEAYGPLPVVK